MTMLFKTLAAAAAGTVFATSAFTHSVNQARSVGLRRMSPSKTSPHPS